MLEASDPKPRPNVIAAVAAFGSDIEFHAEVLKTLNITKRHLRPGCGGDPAVNVQQIFARFGCKNDFPLNHAPSFSRLA
jgi:hypothetical protein